MWTRTWRPLEQFLYLLGTSSMSNPNSSTKLLPRQIGGNALSKSLPASPAGASGTTADRVLHYRAEHAGDRALKKTAQVSPLQLSTPAMRTGANFRTNKLQTKHSSWTPILHKPSNEQVCTWLRLDSTWFKFKKKNQRQGFKVQAHSQMFCFFHYFWFNIKVLKNYEYD